MLISLLRQVLEMLFPLLSGAYIARVLSPAGVGQAAAARNLVSWFGMLAALGIPAYGVREMAACPEKARSGLFRDLAVLNGLSTLAALALYLWWIPRDDLLGRIFALELVFHLFSMDWLYQGLEDYGYLALRSLAVKSLGFLATVLLVKSREDVAVYSWILCLTTGVAGMCNVLRARRFVKPEWKGCALRRHIRPVLILAVSAIAASLYTKLDITMLNRLGSYDQVGWYVNAHKTVSLVLAVAASVTAVFLPRLSHVYRHHTEQLSRYLSGGLELLLLTVLPCWVGLLLVAEEGMLLLFGPEFLPAVPAVRILSVLIPVKGVGDLLCYQLLVSTGKERYFPAARLAAGLTNAVLNWLWIPRWGHNGAAAASVVSELLGNGLLLIPSRKLCRPKLETGFCRAVTVSTGAMALSVWLIRRWIPMPGLRLLLSAALGAAVYTAAVLLQRKTIMGESICTILHRQEKK